MFYSLLSFFELIDGLQSMLPLVLNTYFEIGVHIGTSLRHVVRQFPQLREVVICDDWSFGSSRERVEKVLLEEEFPLERAVFLEGPSHKQLPVYFTTHPDKVFDLVFVDGAHSSGGIRSDLCNVDAHAKIIVAHDTLNVPSLRVSAQKFFDERRPRFWEMIIETDKYGSVVFIDRGLIAKD